MSSDEAAVVIVRMMLERKALYPGEVAITEELQNIGDRLGILGRKLRNGGASSLGPEDTAWIDSCAVSELVSELQAVKSRGA